MKKLDADTVRKKSRRTKQKILASFDTKPYRFATSTETNAVIAIAKQRCHVMSFQVNTYTKLATASTFLSHQRKVKVQLHSRVKTHNLIASTSSYPTYSKAPRSKGRIRACRVACQKQVRLPHSKSHMLPPSSSNKYVTQ